MVLLLPVAAFVGLVGIAPQRADAQAGCRLRGNTRIVRPYPGNSYHFVLLTGEVFCTRGVATKISEQIRRERSGIPDENVASREWREHGTGSNQVYQVGTDCTAANRGQSFHGDVYLVYYTGGGAGETLHVKTNSVKC